MKLLAVEEHVCAEPIWNGILLGYPVLDRACFLPRRGSWHRAGLPRPEPIAAALSSHWQHTGQECWE